MLFHNTFFTSFNHAMNLLENIVGGINKQMHSILSCSPTSAAAGKKNTRVCCWFYDSETPNYVFVNHRNIFPGLALSNSLFFNNLHSNLILLDFAVPPYRLSSVCGHSCEMQVRFIKGSLSRPGFLRISCKCTVVIIHSVPSCSHDSNHYFHFQYCNMDAFITKR
jgi:hypothetical protein